jgi:outer membrane protein assembly factor BamB
MKSRLAVPTVVVAAAVLLFGGTCGPRLHPPDYVSLPASVFSGDTIWVRLATSGSGYGTVHYVVEWHNAETETTGQFRLTDTATVWHVWTAPDTEYVRAAVYPIDNPKNIKWANQERVLVVEGGSHAPVIDTFETPPLAIRGGEYEFTVRAHDPDGDSIRIRIDWGDGQDTTSALLGGPYYFGFFLTHSFTQVETAGVIITVQDQAGAFSLPETVLVPVDTTGGVIWSYAPPWASPLIVNDGVEDCVYFRPLVGLDPGAYGRFTAFTQDGEQKYATPRDSSPYGGAAYCAVTQHTIVSGAALWAFDRQLNVAWLVEMPDSSGDLHWDGPAVNGNRAYFGRGKETLYCYIDSVDRGGRIPAFVAQGAIVDAPAIDAYGAIYFGTDSGYLYKVGPWLDKTFWRVHPAPYKIHGPVVGSDGTIYCASESQSMYAIDPATGTTLWTAVLDGQALRPTVGQTAIFVATTASKAYSIDPATGGTNWVKVLGYPDGFIAAPAVAADGSVYFQSNSDVLYRVNQSDGSVVWICDCRDYYMFSDNIIYPGKRMRPAEYPPSPTILPNGNVIVAGGYGLYCVAGSRAGPLDPLAPWPKWQHDLYNTGYVGGGR